MSDIIGALIGAGATIKAGEQAAQVQRETNAMNIELANTAHQREAKDLEAAGINKLATATGGRGAETPTLQAPTQAAEGMGSAGRQMGNAMAVAPADIIQLMNGFQQVQKTQADTEKTKADTELVKQQTPWVAPQASMNVKTGEATVAEKTQATIESKARTATIEAMRIPQIQNLMTDIAQKAQQTKTEEQRTIEAKAAADNAQKLFGAKAKEASILAAQAATYYNDFFLKEQSQKVNQRDLEIELLKNENYLKVIQGILDNDYGRQIAWGKMFSTIPGAGAQLGGPKGKVMP